MPPVITRPEYIKHRGRLREKFADSGVESLQDYEKLELLLTYDIPRKDVKTAVKARMNKFGTIASVPDADLEELKKVEGVGKYSALMIRLTRNISTTYLGQSATERDLLQSTQSVVNYYCMKLRGSG